MTQGERIKTIRNEYKLTTEKFGDRLGVSKSTISNIENGNRNASSQIIRLICKEFNVDYIWLTTGEGEMFIDEDMSLTETIDRIMAGENEFHKNLIKFSANRTDEELELLEHWIDEGMKLFNTKQKG